MATNELPAISLGLRLQVTSGRNQIQRNVGNYSTLYLVPGSRIADNYIELEPNQTYTANPGEITNNLIISTSGALTFAATKASGGALNMDVNRMLVIDTPLLSYSLTNPGIVAVRISLNSTNSTNVVAATPLYYGASDIPGVFNQAFIESLTKSLGPKDQTVTITAGTTEYLYYCYPVLLGQSNFEVNGFVGGMSVVALANVFTPSGVLQYYVYQSDNPGLGATTLIVTEA